jgi:hypothetical protein
MGTDRIEVLRYLHGDSLAAVEVGVISCDPPGPVVAESDAPRCLPDHIAAGSGCALTDLRGAEVRRASLCGKQAITSTPVVILRTRPSAVIRRGAKPPLVASKLSFSEHGR